MFKGMSENAMGDRGKFQGTTSIKSKSTQWVLGSEPHEPAMTVTARDFNGNAGHKIERT